MKHASKENDNDGSHFHSKGLWKSDETAETVAASYDRSQRMKRTSEPSTLMTEVIAVLETTDQSSDAKAFTDISSLSRSLGKRHTSDIRTKTTEAIVVLDGRTRCSRGNNNACWLRMRS